MEETAFFSLSSRLSRLPDVIQYRIRIEREGHAHEIRCDTECGGASLLELVDRVLELTTGGAG